MRKNELRASVQDARLVAEPFTVMHCCPWDEGAAAVVVCAREVAALFTSQPCPTIVTSVVRSTHTADLHPLLFTWSLMAATARVAYERSGYGPQDLQLIESMMRSRLKSWCIMKPGG